MSWAHKVEHIQECYMLAHLSASNCYLENWKGYTDNIIKSTLIAFLNKEICATVNVLNIDTSISNMGKVTVQNITFRKSCLTIIGLLEREIALFQHLLLCCFMTCLQNRQSNAQRERTQCFNARTWKIMAEALVQNESHTQCSCIRYGTFNF